MLSMLQTSTNSVKILQKSATLHRMVLQQINKITVTGENGQRKTDVAAGPGQENCWYVKIEIAYMT